MKTHRLYDSYISLRRRHGWNASSAYAYAKAMEEVAFQGLDIESAIAAWRRMAERGDVMEYRSASIRLTRRGTQSHRIPG